MEERAYGAAEKKELCCGTKKNGISTPVLSAGSPERDGT